MSRYFVILVVASALCGCDDPGGSRSGNGGGGLNYNVSGVSGSTTVEQLTDAQVTALCEQTNAFFDAQYTDAEEKRMGCLTAALLFAEDKAACETRFDSCMDGPTDPDDDSGDDCATAGADRPANCKATVDQMEACIEAQAAAARVAFAALSCDQAGQASPNDDDTLPPACAAVQAVCPAFFTSDDTPELPPQ